MVPPTENIKKENFGVCVMCLLYLVTVYVIGSNKVYLNWIELNSSTVTNEFWNELHKGYCKLHLLLLYLTSGLNHMKPTNIGLASKMDNTPCLLSVERDAYAQTNFRISFHQGSIQPSRMKYWLFGAMGFIWCSPIPRYIVFQDIKFTNITKNLILQTCNSGISS